MQRQLYVSCTRVYACTTSHAYTMWPWDPEAAVLAHSAPRLIVTVVTIKLNQIKQIRAARAAAPRTMAAGWAGLIVY